MHDLVVIGGGPAGLTATMYAVQKRLDVMLVTRDLGGKTNYHLQLPFVERHMVINGDEVISRFAREIEYLDFLRRLDNAERVAAIDGGYRVHLSSGEELDTRTVIVATGAKAQMLEVPGEREFMMRGLCYSAISYAQLFIERTAAVVGSGDLGLRGAAELARVARRVTVIGESDDIPQTALGRQLLAQPHVDFKLGSRVKAVKGDTYARSVVIESVNGSHEEEIEVDAVFVELELIPRTDAVAALVDLDEKGRIVINARNETSTAGIFAAGDVTDGYAEQVLIGIGEGAKAALSAWEYLLKQEVLSGKRV